MALKGGMIMDPKDDIKKRSVKLFTEQEAILEAERGGCIVAFY